MKQAEFSSKTKIFNIDEQLGINSADAYFRAAIELRCNTLLTRVDNRNISH